MSQKGGFRTFSDRAAMAGMRPLRPVLASAPVLESGHHVGETLQAALGGKLTLIDLNGRVAGLAAA